MNEIATSGTALTSEQAFPFQSEIDTWNAESAIERLRPKVEQLKKVSVEVARDLFIAHEALALRGGDRRSEDAQVFGFCDFLELVGLSKKTAYLWLKLYDPIADCVRTPEELTALKSANPQIEEISPQVQELQTKKEQLIAHAMATGERLYNEGWNEFGCEAEYRLRKSNERLAEIAHTWTSKKVQVNYGKDDYFSTTVLANGKNFAKINLQNKEQYAAQLAVFDMLDQYLKSFTDPAVRMSAVCNIALRIRAIVNDMHKSDVELGIAEVGA
ncbi:MAG: hypothetical protein IJ523_12760 [Succinivibrionaceae bacterium]|nr:hypothetical protein [Succinivibrionaceae bacterium]